MEELKENIPRAGPKYRLGMYFETIHNLPHFDEIASHNDDNGYTSYWETDTEVDSDFGNFIFNNVAGDSASLICIDEVDLIALRNRQEEVISKAQPTHHNHHHHGHAHYKLEQRGNGSGPSPATSPSSEEHPLEMSLESKQSAGSNSQHSSRRSYHSSHHHHQQQQGGILPPPVPPPRRPSTTANSGGSADDLQDHTYETLDDCKDQYHLAQTIYVSKASDDSRGSQDSVAKPVSSEGADFHHYSTTCHVRQQQALPAPPAPGKSPPHVSSGSSKPRSASLQMTKSPECCCEASGYRQRRKLSEPVTNGRKRRLEKVGSKGSGYPPPVKGFPAGVPEDYADYMATTTSTMCGTPERRTTTPERRSSPVMCSPPSPVASPSQRQEKSGDNATKKGSSSSKAAPLVIKHKGKTYLVPVVDKKLQRELERKSKAENPSVTMKYGAPGVYRSSSNSSSNNAGPPRSFASPPKVDPTDHASSHRRRSSGKCTSSPQKVPTKTPQVTHYGVF